MKRYPNMLIWIVSCMVVMSLQFSGLVFAQSADEKALLHFNLTMPLVEKCAAVNEQAAAIAKRNPQRAKELEAAQSSGDGSLAGTVKDIERSPELTRLIKSQGLSVREYVLTSFALLEAGLYSTMRKSSPGLKPPANTNMANVEFFEAHRVELQKIQSRMKSLENTGSSNSKSNAAHRDNDGDDDK